MSCLGPFYFLTIYYSTDYYAIGRQKESKLEVVGKMQLLRISEAAKRLEISRSMVYLLINRGEIPSVRIGSILRVPAEALDELIQNKTIGGLDRASDRVA